MKTGPTQLSERQLQHEYQWVRICQAYVRRKGKYCDSTIGKLAHLAMMYKRNTRAYSVCGLDGWVVIKEHAPVTPCKRCVKVQDRSLSAMAYSIYKRSLSNAK